MSSDTRRIFYVYVLFDWLAVPRYVGKGKGRRWLQHERKRDPNNPLKNKFIERTLALLGEIPKIKVRQDISEAEAFVVETALIRAIGRWPKGPLVNLTDKRNGPSSERIRAWHASRSPEERSATAKKSVASMTPEALSARGRNNALAQGREILAERMRQVQARRSAEERSDIARRAGNASAASTTLEQKRRYGLMGIAAYMAQTTAEERKANAKRSGIGKFTKMQLSEFGKRGVAIANANRTPEERRALSRKAGLASAASQTPEERSAFARKGSVAARLVIASQPPEFRTATAEKGWVTRRLRGKISTPTKGSRWITDGKENRRLYANGELPIGWNYGQTTRRKRTYIAPSQLEFIW